LFKFDSKHAQKEREEEEKEAAKVGQRRCDI
jgi:hypothetical protein